MRDKVFISYSHQDAKWLKRLQVHLKPLIRDESIDIWDDTKIRPGDKWLEEIQNALDTAKVAVLLISAEFLASDFIAYKELPELLNAAENEGATILSLIISPSLFLDDPALSQIQSFNPPDKPLSGLDKTKQNEVFVGLAKQIKSALQAAVPVFKAGEVKVNEVHAEKTAKTQPVRIWFSNPLNPDPISIELAVLAFESGQREFVVDWHPDNNLLLETVKTLYESSSDYRNENSKLYGVPVKSLQGFLSSASRAMVSSQLREKIANRIPLILEEMNGYFDDHKAMVLSNFLTLANYESFYKLNIALSHLPNYGRDYFREHWHRLSSWFWPYTYRKLFEIDEPIGSGRLWTLGDVNIDILIRNQRIYAPLIMLLESYSRRQRHGLESLLHHFIPQIELFMVNHAPDTGVVSYDWNLIRFDKIWECLDDNNIEIESGSYEEELRSRNPDFFERLLRAGIINEYGRLSIT